MNNPQKLLNLTEDIERGQIIRCKGNYPHEDIVDLMVCNSYEDDYGACLMVVSGYKAGLRLVILPKESIPIPTNGYAVSRDWLISNWIKWVYDSPLEDVWIIDTPVPILPSII